MRRLRRAEIARQRVHCLSPPSIDTTRPTKSYRISGLGISSDNVTEAFGNYGELSAHEVVHIDEAQFFSEEIVDVLRQALQIWVSAYSSLRDSTPTIAGGRSKTMPLARYRGRDHQAARRVRCATEIPPCIRNVSSRVKSLSSSARVECEARSRRCLTNPALAQEKKDAGPQLIIRNRAASANSAGK